MATATKTTPNTRQVTLNLSDQQYQLFQTYCEWSEQTVQDFLMNAADFLIKCDLKWNTRVD